jgi:hypothetical protein
MKEPKPKGIQPEVFGVKQDPSLLNRSIESPVLRNRQNFLTWTLSGNTAQENEKLGIANVRFLFLEAFPEFSQRFPRDEQGIIDESKREESKQYIIDKIGNLTTFRKVIPSAIHNSIAPYFEGQLYIALQKSFKSWGIKFFDDDIRKAEDTNLYLDNEGNGYLLNTDISHQYNIDRKTTKKKLEGVTKKTVLGQNGHLVSVYSQKEVRERLETYVNLPQAEHDSNVFVDNTGQRWLTLSYTHTLYGVTPNTIRKRLGETPHITGRAGSSETAELYPEPDLLVIINQFLSLPKISEELGEYTDQDGNKWAHRATLTKKYAVSKTFISQKLKGVSSIQGRDNAGREIVLYNFKEAENILSNIALLPLVDPDLGKYIDSDQESWISITHVKKITGNRNDLQEQLTQIRSIKGRTLSSSEVDLWNESEIKKAFADVINLPSIQKKEATYTDENGDTWIVKTKLLEKLGIGDTTLAPFLEDVPTMEVRGGIRTKTLLYKENEVMNKMQKFLNSPRLDKKTGRYIDPEGKIWVSLDIMGKELGVDRQTLITRSADLQFIFGRSRNNTECTLYLEEEVRKTIQENPPSRVRRKKENSSQGLALLEEYNMALQNALKKGKNISFEEFIRSNYE